MNVRVCIHVGDEMKSDLYRLYCRRNPFVQGIIVFLGMAILLLAFVWMPATGHVSFQERGPLAAMGGLLILSAFYLRQVWWRWHYWPGVQRDYSAAEACWVELSATGIRQDELEAEFPYGRYRGLSMDERAVLLFVSKSYPVPFHRSLFATDAEWQFFCDAVREAFKHRTLLQRLNQPI